MTSPILVTGATGTTGGALLSELAARDVPVRAMVAAVALTEPGTSTGRTR